MLRLSELKPVPCGLPCKQAKNILHTLQTTLCILSKKWRLPKIAAEQSYALFKYMFASWLLSFSPHCVS